MKKIIILVSAFCFLTILAAAQYDNSTMNQDKNTPAFKYEKKPDVPEGMEETYIGSVKFVIPKGAKVFKETAGVYTIENANEYVARKINELEARLQQMDAKDKELSEKIAQLNQALEQMKAIKQAAAAEKTN